MKNLMKMIAITVMMTLLICAVISCAAADEKIYTSPSFKLPADKIASWAEGLPEEQGEPEEGEQPEEGFEEPEEGTELPQDEDEGEGGEEAQPGEEGKEPQRSVRIFSSQGSVVTEGEIIYLTSKLEGFDGLDVSFQWQVDRGDGAGWVDVEGATRAKHMFIASKETIKYSWRLVVNVDE